MPRPHSVSDCEYIRIRHFRERHASGAVDRIVISPQEPWQYANVSVRVFVRHVFVKLFADRAMATFHYSAFHIRVSTDLKLNAILSQQGLECSIQKLFALICSHPDGTSAYRFRILREYGTKCRAQGCARLGPQRYDSRYFEKTSITLNRLVYLSLYLLRDCISIR